jgi:hypothetical protein
MIPISRWRMEGRHVLGELSKALWLESVKGWESKSEWTTLSEATQLPLATFYNQIIIVKIVACSDCLPNLPLANLAMRHLCLSLQQYFLGGGDSTVVWTLHLLGRCSTTSAPFSLVIWKIRSCFLLRLALSTIAGNDRHVPLHSAISWDGVSQSFCLGWPQTVIHWSQPPK